MNLITRLALVVTVCSGMAPCAAISQVLIDESFDSLPAGYQLVPVVSANASASGMIGDVGGSNAIIVDAVWNVPVGGSESAAMLLDPAGAPVQLDPASRGGLFSVVWSIDAATSCSSSLPSGFGGMFPILVIFQTQPDNSVTLSGYRLLITPGPTQTYAFELAAEDFDLYDGPPDFSVNGGVIRFGLLMGATYMATTEAYTNTGRLTADNWRVSISETVFRSGFDGPPPAQSPGNPQSMLTCPFCSR